MIQARRAGLGRSEASRDHALFGLAEGRGWLAHPVFGPRLVEAVRALRKLPGHAVATRLWRSGHHRAEGQGRIAGDGRTAAGSGIISPDNNDDTAASSWHLHQDARLPPERTVVWNIVPWHLGTTVAMRAAKTEDVAAAQPYLHRFLDLLPDLRIVVVFGDKGPRWLAPLPHT